MALLFVLDEARTLIKVIDFGSERKRFSMAFWIIGLRSGDIIILLRASRRKCPKSSVKLVLLDEADAMTKDAQFALRQVIEKYTKNTRLDVSESGLAALVPLCNGDMRKALNIL
ncbi:hypothetical protein Vadar_010178 [Vaccinium darrowii]|uniref:Uncharacterized protein n=1 Tax=Vaccinium darrowii TaxID=229202 RepID=A0ACB7WZB7_9ERIC|nr:hypothetical protein Vadar_010178 [Vaccinium darrowii]